MSSPGNLPPSKRPIRPMRPVLLRPQPVRPKEASEETSGEESSKPFPSADGLLPPSKPVKSRIPLKQDIPDTSDMTVRETPEVGEEDAVEKIAKGAPPWMISLIFHIVAILALALYFLPGMVVTEYLELEATISEVMEEEDIWMEELGEQTEIETDSVEPIPDIESMQVFEERDVPDPMAAPIELPSAEGGTLASSNIQAPAGSLLNGRTPGGRNGLVGRYGGTKSTEAAVELGLQWLSRQQLRDGSWSLLGPYADGVNIENQASATAMALLAFQGAGYTTKPGKYKRLMDRGWNWLLAQQDAEGNFYTEGAHNHPFYTQGQCTIALCELLAMTKESRWKTPAEKAVQYIIRSQSKEGGWRYEPNVDSDVSVTGWCVMALQSAKMAGLEVPQQTLDNVTKYLDKVAQAGGTRYPYQRNGDATRTMTAEAILCRQYLGWKQDDPRMANALNYVLTNPVSYEHKRDVYYWYYATQAMHHMEGKWWKEWNAVMRQEIPEHQIKTGRESGSWDPRRPTEDLYGLQAGRLYVTCLSIYNLEVYYRHLPIYANTFDADGLPVPKE